MMEAPPAAAFVVAEPQLLLELLIIALDAPAQLGGVDEPFERGIGTKGGEPVFERFGVALGPFDQQPFLSTGVGQFKVPGGRAQPNGGEPGLELSVGSFAPGNRLP